MDDPYSNVKYDNMTIFNFCHLIERPGYRIYRQTRRSTWAIINDSSRSCSTCNNIYKSQNNSKHYGVVFVTNKFFVVVYLLKEKINVLTMSLFPICPRFWKRVSGRQIYNGRINSFKSTVVERCLDICLARLSPLNFIGKRKHRFIY